VKSIIVERTDRCVICGSPYVEIHHAIHGTANRKVADKYGLTIPLCHEHHLGALGPHLNRTVDLTYIKAAQRAFESKVGTREEFRKLFGKSWL
jgi:hypothetical protein